MSGLLAAACVAFAQPRAALSLDDCVRLAMNAPSTVVAARQQLLISKYGVRPRARDCYLNSLFSNAFTYNSPFRNGYLATGPQSFIALNSIRVPDVRRCQPDAGYIRARPRRVGASSC
jgi:hypothetical protein